MILTELSNGIFTAGRRLTDAEKAVAWRNDELVNTDWIVPVTDHPELSNYLDYRQALRDWPATSDFPSTKPTLQD